MNSQSSPQPDKHEIDDRYNFHDASFRRHYQIHLSDGGRDYEDFYAPAYRFGYELAEENANKEWGSAMAEAEQHWQNKHGSAWSEVASAVQFGWEEQRNPERHKVDHHGDFDQYRNTFEEHYNAELHEEGMAFDAYVPAYQYGHTLATNPEHRTRLWADVEPEVREYWESEYQDHMPWEHYRTASQRAWNEARDVPAA